MQKLFLLFSGPTAVGKSDFVNRLTDQAPELFAIINGDMGQLYTPLSIGTAKPDWKNQAVAHYLFDVIEKPHNYTVSEYRQAVVQCLEKVWSAGKIPIIVGGSGFYLKSLFFPPQDLDFKYTPEEVVNVNLKNNEQKTPQELWQELYAIDPERATTIHMHDVYRVERALTIWYTTGIKPSEAGPLYTPPGNYIFLHLTREREELYTRINARTKLMIEQGWIDEVKSLSSAWRSFLREKRLIGYPEIIEFLEDSISKQELVESISMQTRAYAKRQETFWKSLKKQLVQSDTEQVYLKHINEVNLTLSNVDLYLKQLLSIVKSLN